MRPSAARHAIAAMACLTALWSAPGEAQTAYPVRNVRIIVPTAPGGGGDTLARIISQGLSERWGRQVITDNRVGAATMIGSEIVAKAAPDGYTLLQGLTTLAINPATYKSVPYDALRDFAPITHAISLPNLLLVHPSLPAQTAGELAALARARPGELLYASAGHGTNNHLTLELFCSMAKVRMMHVPYKSSGPGMVDLLAGQVAVMATNMIAALPHVQNGKLRALGVTSLQRSPGAPEIPTIAESGLPGFESVPWYGLLAPAATPREIIEKIQRDTANVLRADASRSRLSADGAMVVAGSPEAFAQFLRAETEKWAKVVQSAGLKPE